MDQLTVALIEKYSPILTNKQIWEYEQTHNEIKFDLMYVKPGNKDEKSWSSRLAYLDGDIRIVLVRTIEYLIDGYELWVRNSKNNQRNQDESVFSYIMALIVDIMIDEEICLKFREDENCLVLSIDTKADVIDCKEFFEAFYHLATGVNYDMYIGIPEDETEAEMYLSRLQEDFDQKMRLKLGEKYLPGNTTPDSINKKLG